MKIEKVIVGNLEENCYIIIKDNKVLVIDPGDEIDKIKKKIEDRKVVGVLITHKHFDHIGALNYFQNIPVYSFSNLEEKEYNIDNFKFQVILTPGHSEDSISYYFKDINSLFSGDFIFYESIGRCDLPTGNIQDMMKSIAKIKKYPQDMQIYPGHGISTTLRYEIENNKYLSN